MPKHPHISSIHVHVLKLDNIHSTVAILRPRHVKRKKHQEMGLEVEHTHTYNRAFIKSKCTTKHYHITCQTVHTTPTWRQINCNDRLNIDINSAKIERMPKVKYLGLYIEEDLKWKSDILHVSATVSQHIGIIGWASKILQSKHIPRY